MINSHAMMLGGRTPETPEMPTWLTSSTIACVRFSRVVNITGVSGSFLPGEAIEVRRSGIFVEAGTLTQSLSASKLAVSLAAAPVAGDVVSGLSSGASATISTTAIEVVDIGPSKRAVTNGGLTSTTDKWGDAVRGLGDTSAEAYASLPESSDFLGGTVAMVDLWLNVANPSTSGTFFKLGSLAAANTFFLIRVYTGPVIQAAIRPSSTGAVYTATTPVVTTGQKHICVALPLAAGGAMRVSVNGDWKSSVTIPVAPSWGASPGCLVGRYTLESTGGSLAMAMTDVRISRQHLVPPGIDFIPPAGPCRYAA